MRQLMFRTGGTDRIPVLLPADARVAHKTGEIPGVRNDVAIVYAPRGTYVLAVLSQDPDEGEAMARIARLSRHVYDYFVGR
jgi:beta-lactamase class A